MKITKNVKDSKIGNSIPPRKKNIRTDIDLLNYSNQMFENSGIYLPKILKTNDRYQTIDYRPKMDPNSINDYKRKIQNNFSSDGKSQKTMSYIIDTLNEENKKKYKQLIANSYNDSYFSEQKLLDLSKIKNLDSNKKDYINNNDIRYNNNNCNEMEIKTPKRGFENLNLNSEDICNNNTVQKNFNCSKNNLNFVQMKMENLYPKSRNANEYTYKKKAESMTKKYNKNKSKNEKQDFYKKLNYNGNDKKTAEENCIRDYRVIDNTNLAKSIQSPKYSTSIRQFSPFNDILNKSNNTFFINKIPVNDDDNNNFNDLSVKHAYNKSCFQTKNMMEKENLSLNKLTNDNDNIRKMNNSNLNNVLSTLDNNYDNKNKIIYRNKLINQKLFQSSSLRNNENRNKYRRKYLYSKIKNDDEKENNIDLNDIRINEFNINNKEKKSKNIQINGEELKKYLNYFIKDITPININQFVIYSHSNNNYKTDENIFKNNEIDNKNKADLNKSHEVRYLKKHSRNINSMNNSVIIQDFNHTKFKDNILDINTTSNLNKILVKKRPINENIIHYNNHSIDYKHSHDNKDNFTGLTLCKKSKGETIMDIPISINNLYIINEYLKESGFEIIKTKQIETNKKEDTKTYLNKENQNTSNEINKFSDKKEKEKYNTFIPGLYSEYIKRKNTSQKQRQNLKKNPSKLINKENTKKNIKKLKNDVNTRSNIAVKLRERNNW